MALKLYEGQKLMLSEMKGIFFIILATRINVQGINNYSDTVHFKVDRNKNVPLIMGASSIFLTHSIYEIMHASGGDEQRNIC